MQSVDFSYPFLYSSLVSCCFKCAQPFGFAWCQSLMSWRCVIQKRMEVLHVTHLIDNKHKTRWVFPMILLSSSRETMHISYLHCILHLYAQDKITPYSNYVVGSERNFEKQVRFHYLWSFSTTHSLITKLGTYQFSNRNII